jgi:hypothetical protein
MVDGSTEHVGAFLAGLAREWIPAGSVGSVAEGTEGRGGRAEGGARRGGIAGFLLGSAREGQGGTGRDWEGLGDGGGRDHGQ